MDEQDNNPKPNPPKKPENPEQLLTLHKLSAMRSQIINPDTPKHTVSAILETLTRYLQLTNHDYHHIILKLLSDISHHHPSLSQLAFESVRSYTLPPEESQTRLAAELLDAFASTSEETIHLDDEFFVSLCLKSESVQGRLWILRNVGTRFWVRPAILFTVLFGYTKDPYPYVREASLEGLVRLGECAEFEDVALVKGCYEAAVGLLEDMEDCVRVSAVRVVALWGQLLAAFNADTMTYWSNEVFAKLCSMVRDMNMKVRVEAFNGLRKMETVSEELLLQSLSKRVSVSGRQRETLGQDTDEQIGMLANSVAGALVHGIEDEFFEVRKSVCRSLCALIIFSAEFASEALSLLMDVLNDDYVEVRVQALETMHHMATNGCLKLQEKHMDMFLDVLVDNNRDVRYAGREVLKLVKLNDRALFKSAIDGLLKNLDRYQQDEADVFSAVSHLGRNHKKFTNLIVKEITGEIEATFGGNTEFYSPRIAALLVLSISAPLLDGDVGRTPPVLFSYASTCLGRIHCAFSDVMDSDAFLAYLCEKSGSAERSETDSKEEEGQLPLSEDDAPNLASNEMVDSEIQPPSMEEPEEVAHDQVEEQQPAYEGIYCANYILAKFPDIWLMVQSGSTDEVLSSLSVWKEELTTIKVDSPGCADALAFTSLYLRVMKLLAEVWEHLLPEKSVDSGKGELELKLGKLESRAKELMCRFVGFSAEEELNVLELVSFIYALRLCRVEICNHNFAFKRLTTIYPRVESLIKERSTFSFNFIHELGRLLHEKSTASHSPHPFVKCLKLFSLKQFVFSDTIRYTWAEISFPNNDSEHPRPFVPGLPARIPCEVTLHDVSSKSFVWIRMRWDEGTTHHVYLDLSRFEVCGEVRKLALDAPYYWTPDADSFKLNVCVGLQSMFENVTPVQPFGGPQRELVPLCKEKPIYLSQVKKE